MLRVIVIGAGINGVTAAIELKKRGHRVVLVDPGPLPHPLAASSDISKAVRSTYGADEQYTALAEEAIDRWHQWNEEAGVDLYHEVGVMFVRQRKMEPGDYEYESYHLGKKRGRPVIRVNSDWLRERFPAWNEELYPDGLFDPRGGYAESGRVVAQLVVRAKSLGIELHEGARFLHLDEGDSGVRGVVLDNEKRLPGDGVVAAMGAWTPFALPFTQPFFRATGHPLFHLRPEKPEIFAPECFPMFGADITTTGYYGFPIGREGVVKIGSHGIGREMSPDSPERLVTAEEESKFRDFVSSTFPALANAPIVSTRICLYCDTHDGNFWIAADPERAGLVIAAGDNGHGFKFAPLLGEVIADAVEGKENPLAQKFRWRPEVRAGESKEAARFVPSDGRKGM